MLHLAGGKESPYVGRFCYLNIPCLRINITLPFMSSSSNKFTHLKEDSKTDVSAGFWQPY